MDELAVILFIVVLLVLGYGIHRSIEAHFVVRKALWDAQVRWVLYLASIQRRR